MGHPAEKLEGADPLVTTPTPFELSYENFRAQQAGQCRKRASALLAETGWEPRVKDRKELEAVAKFNDGLKGKTPEEMIAALDRLKEEDPALYDLVDRANQDDTDLDLKMWELEDEDAAVQQEEDARREEAHFAAEAEVFGELTRKIEANPFYQKLNAPAITTTGVDVTDEGERRVA